MSPSESQERVPTKRHPASKDCRHVPQSKEKNSLKVQLFCTRLLERTYKKEVTLQESEGGPRKGDRQVTNS